jgi:hypothetical protein
MDSTPTPPPPPEKFSLVCMACARPFETADAYRHLCPACKEELHQMLHHKLAPLCPPGEDPLRKLYGPPPRD